MRLAPLLLVPVLVVGLAGAVVAVASHESDTAFLYKQEHPTTLEPQQMENAVVKAPDPVPGANRAAARDATCKPGSKPPNRNPWVCTVRYQSGNTIRYRIEVALDGNFHGVDPTGQYVVDGHVAGAGLSTGG
jgi:hypothetical protein